MQPFLLLTQHILCSKNVTKQLPLALFQVFLWQIVFSRRNPQTRQWILALLLELLRYALSSPAWEYSKEEQNQTQAWSWTLWAWKRANGDALPLEWHDFLKQLKMLRTLWRVEHDKRTHALHDTQHPKVLEGGNTFTGITMKCAWCQRLGILPVTDFYLTVG